MTILITLRLHRGCIGGIFITGIFGNFYTERGEFLTSRTGIPDGLDAHLLPRGRHISGRLFCFLVPSDNFTTRTRHTDFIKCSWSVVCLHHANHVVWWWWWWWRSRTFDLTSQFQNGGHDVNCHRKVAPSGECSRSVCTYGAYTAASGSSI